MQTTLPLISRSKTARPRSEKTRILFGLSPTEREIFFSWWRDSSTPRHSIQWAEPADLIADGWREKLANIRPHVVVTGWSTPMIPLSHVQAIDSELAYVCHVTGSIRGKVSLEAISGGLQVSNWGTLISHTVAEHGLLLVLACLRNLNAWHEAFDCEPRLMSQIKKTIQPLSLRERRVGIHGFGSIAREIIPYLKPFQTRVSVYSQGVPADYIRSFQVEPVGSLEELFAENDVIIECEALRPESRLSVTRRILELLPDEAVFVNIARGALVDEEALAAVTLQKRLRVGLDVFAREPLPMDSPLRQVSGILLSPHIAGPTKDWYVRCGQFAWNNVERFLEGKMPNSLVDLATYERST